MERKRKAPHAATGVNCRSVAQITKGRSLPTLASDLFFRSFHCGQFESRLRSPRAAAGLLVNLNRLPKHVAIRVRQYDVTTLIVFNNFDTDGSARHLVPIAILRQADNSLN